MLMTTLARFAARFKWPASRRGFRRDARGVAAIEAALIMPFAIALVGLLAIWAEGIAIQRKVTLTARTITDIVSQEASTVGPTELTKDLSASSAVFAPYPSKTLTMVVSEVLVTGSGDHRHRPVELRHLRPRHGAQRRRGASPALRGRRGGHLSHRRNGDLRLRAAGHRTDSRADAFARHDLSEPAPDDLNSLERFGLRRAPPVQAGRDFGPKVRAKSRATA